MTSKTLHSEILKQLKKNAGKPSKHFDVKKYLGHNHISYHTPTSDKRRIAKEFLKKHESLSNKDFFALLTLLFKSKSFDEKSVGGLLLEYSKKHRENINPNILGTWLPHLIGWAEIDSLCQSNFTQEELLSDWTEWKKVLVQFSKSKCVSKRRASLVLLVKSVSKSKDPRLSKIAFENINRLKHEKDILITKAVSWLLRALTHTHKKEVWEYVKKNKETLPKIAVRETTRKIKTGRK